MEEKHSRFIVKAPRVDMDYAESRDSVRPFFDEGTASIYFIYLRVLIDVAAVVNKFYSFTDEFM